MTTKYLATADLATITGDYAIAVDTIVPVRSDGETGIGWTVYRNAIDETDTPDDEQQLAAWDAALTAAGFERTGDWSDHGGYWTADVDHANATPIDLSELRSALAALEHLDPAHRARRCPVLGEAAKSILGTYRDAAVYAASSPDRGGYAAAAAAIGVSEANVNGAVTRHRARTGAA